MAAMAMLAGGCATMSPSDERRLGQMAAQEVEQTVGLVRDPGWWATSGRWAAGWRTWRSVPT